MRIVNARGYILLQKQWNLAEKLPLCNPDRCLSLSRVRHRSMAAYLHLSEVIAGINHTRVYKRPQPWTDYGNLCAFETRQKLPSTTDSLGRLERLQSELEFKAGISRCNGLLFSGTG